ncbi:MAG: response regulator transcription factor [Magnetospirillum sp.]|nr:response regulator transcription factor [Magnetospirillum sp.]
MVVLIADDHALFRYGIALALEGLYGKDVTILQASTAEETRRIAHETSTLDLILLDLMMPGLNGIAELKKFIETLPPVPVVIVSGSRQRATIRSAIEAGARGYVLKSSNGEILKHVLPLVLSGELYVPAQAVATEDSGQEFEPGASPLDEAGDFNPDFRSLTPRETQVLKLLTLGYSNKEIARSLGMLEGTVKVHVKSIMKKLGVNNRTQAAIAANRSFSRQGLSGAA